MQYRILTCSDRIPTCSDRILTCSDRILTCSHKIPTCSDRLPTCSDRILTCNGRVLTCSDKILTCSYRHLFLTGEISLPLKVCREMMDGTHALKVKAGYVSRGQYLAQCCKVTAAGTETKDQP
jgi:hypothetical protein